MVRKQNKILNQKLKGYNGLKVCFTFLNLAKQFQEIS